MDTATERQAATGEISRPAGETAEQIVFTMGPQGQIVNLERIDKSGLRKIIQVGDYAELSGDAGVDEVDEALSAGYETGLLEGLGDDDLFERVLLFGLITRRTGRNMRALRRAMLRRTLLRRLVRRYSSQNVKGET